MSRHGLGFFHQRYGYNTQCIPRQSQLMLMTWIAQKKQNRRGAYRRFVFTNNVAPKYNLLVLDLFKILQKKKWQDVSAIFRMRSPAKTDKPGGKLLSLTNNYL